MNIRDALVAYLTAQASLSAVGARIGPNPLPQKPTLPAITFSGISAKPDQALAFPSSLTREGFQFDVWAADQVTCDQVTDALVALLHGARNQFGMVFVQKAWVTNILEFYEPVTGYYRRAIDVAFWYGPN